jgi:hypothetical protein
MKITITRKPTGGIDLEYDAEVLAAADAVAEDFVSEAINTLADDITRFQSAPRDFEFKPSGERLPMPLRDGDLDSLKAALEGNWQAKNAPKKS